MGATNPLLPGSPRLLPDCAVADGGCDGLGSVFILLVNASEIIMALTGVVLLVTFIYGGILYLTSAGRSDMISKAKKAIFGSIGGLLIVFGAYTAVTFAVSALIGDTSGTLPGAYVQCASDRPGQAGGTTLQPINDGQPCGPSATCQNGACVTEPGTVNNATTTP